MSKEDEPDYYMLTVERLEPDIKMIDAGAFYASAAISFKRIADAVGAVHKRRELTNICDQLTRIADQLASIDDTLMKIAKFRFNI